MTLTPYLVVTTAAGKLLDSGAPQPYSSPPLDALPFPGRPALSTARTPLFPINSWSDAVRTAVHVTTSQTGKPSFPPLTVSRPVDAATPTLFADLCRGAQLKFVDLLLLNNFPGDDYPNVIHEAVGLGDVLVHSLDWSAASGSSDAPVEEVSFAFGRFWTAYAKLDDYGRPGKFLVKGWDRVAAAPL